MLKSNINRRSLLIGSSGALSAAAIPRILRGQSIGKHSGTTQSFAELLASDQVSAIAAHAVDIAQTNGAMYSDVRVTRRVNQTLTFEGQVSANVWDEENMGINVRVLLGR